MPLLPAMFLQAQASGGAEVAEQAVPHPTPSPDHSLAPLPTPSRPQTSDPVAQVLKHNNSSDQHETVAGSFPSRDDTPLGGDFHPSPPRSSHAPPAGQPPGGEEDPITLTALSSVISTLVQKVHSLEAELHDHKKLFKDVVGKLVNKVKTLEVKLKTKKRKMVVSDSDQEDDTTQNVDLDALRALANAAVATDSDIPSGNTSHVPAASLCVPTAGPPGTSDVPPAPSAIPPGASGVSPGPSVAPTAASAVPADSSKVPVAVPVDSPNVHAGVSSKGKSPMVKEDIPVKARTFRQMKEDRLGEEAAKWLHKEEMAAMDRERAEAQRQRQQEVLESAMFYNEADWLNIRDRVEANASLSKTLLGDDVSEDNFPARMAALIKKKRQALAEQLFKERQNRPMTPAQQNAYMQKYVKNQSSAIYNTGWTMAYVEIFSDEQLLHEFEKIRKVQSQSQIQAFSQTLKRPGPVLEEPSTKWPKSPEAPTPSMPEVPISPAVTLPPYSRTRRKSLGRKPMHKPKSTLPTLDLDARAQMFLKVVVDEDSDDEDSVDEVWSTVVGWEVLPTPLGEINALYRIDGGKGSCIWNNQNQWEIRSWRLYTLLNVHVLETVSGVVLSMFTDVSYPLLVELMKKMLMHKLEIDSDFMGNDLTTAEVEMVINSPWIMPILGIQEFASPKANDFWYIVPTCRVIVPTGRYVVPTGRVIVPTGRGMVNNIGNAKKFLMYPRFLQTILEVAEQAVPHPTPSPDHSPAPLPTPSRPQTSDPVAQVLKHNNSSDQHETVAGSFPSRDDAPLGGDFHPSPPKSSHAPPAGQPSGGEEDPITLTALSSIVSTLVQKVHSLEAELHDHKKLFKDVVGKLVNKVKTLEVKLKTKKRKMVVSDSNQEDGTTQNVDLDALRALANAAVATDSDIPSGNTSHVPAASLCVPTAGPPGTSDVPPAPSAIPHGASGVSPGPSVALTAASAVPADSSKVPAAVPVDSPNVPASVSSKGKSPMVKEDIPVKARTFRQMKEDRLGKEAAKRLHEEEMAAMDRERAEAQRQRQQEVLESAMFYNEADWLNIRDQVEANASLSKTLLGDDVSEDNFPVRMAALIKKKRQALAEQLFKERQNRPMTPTQQKAYMQKYVKNQSSAIYNTGWTMAYVEIFSDEQLLHEFEKIRKVQSQSQIQAFSQTLKRPGPVLEEPSTKRPKSPEAPTSSMPEVPISPAITSPPYSRTRRKSLSRKPMHKPKSTLPTLDLDARAQTFLKVVVDEDSDDEDSVNEVWSTVVGWEVLPTPLGEINALYRIDGGKGSCVWNNQNQWEIRSWRLYTLLNVHVLETVSGAVLSMFTDVSYPLSVELMKKMLMHKLEIDSDFMGNDLTTAE
nr:JmjC domain-containing protein [Tanacetum cinerariifolium]